MFSQEQLVWEEPFTVRTYEAGPDAHATIQTIVRYLLEAASNHAEALNLAKTYLDPKGLAWVLYGLHIQIERYPAWREAVRVETWPSKKEMLHALRDFLIFDAEENIIGRAVSSWMMIDTKTRRAVRLPDFMQSFENTAHSRAIETAPGKLPAPAQKSLSATFAVRYSDLDMNRHVNAAVYLTWAMEVVPAELRESHFLEKVQLNFRSEATYGQKVFVEAEVKQKESCYTLLHRISENSGGRELCRVVSRWTEQRENLPD